MLTILLCVGGGGIGGCGGGAAGTGIEVTGKLYDTQTGAPIANARLVIAGSGLVTFTDENGNFSYAGVQHSGALTVIATIDGAEYSALISDIPLNQQHVVLSLGFDSNKKELDGEVESGDDASEDRGSDGSERHINPIPTPPPGPSIVPEDPPLPPESPDPPDEDKRPVVSPPTVEPYKYYTTDSTLTFRGNKAAGTGIYVGGDLVYPIDSSTTWGVTVTLAEGDNIFLFSAATIDGRRSTVVGKRAVRDTRPPEILGAILVPKSKNELTLQVVTDGATGVYANLANTERDLPTIWASQASNLRRTVASLQALDTRSVVSASNVRVFNLDISTAALRGPRGHFTFSLLDAVNNTASYSFEADRSLVQPHPLAPTRIIFSDEANAKISALSDLTEASPKIFPLQSNARSSGIAFDELNRCVYWIDSLRKIIFKSSGPGQPNIPVSPVAAVAKSLRFDPIEQRLYWLEASGAEFRIVSVDLGDGTIGVVAQLDSLVAGPVLDLALDPILRRIYWSEPTGGKIGRVGLDGSKLEYFVANAGTPTYLALDFQPNGKLYWINEASSTIQAAPLEDPVVETSFEIDSRVGSVTALAGDFVSGELFWFSTSNNSASLHRFQLLTRQYSKTQLPEDSRPKAFVVTKENYNIRGRLTADGAPLSGYSVKVGDITVRSDADGRYAVANLPYGMSFSAYYYTPDGMRTLGTRMGTITGDQIIDMDVNLSALREVPPYDATVDVNSDGLIGANDLNLVLFAFGSQIGERDFKESSDVVRDGIIDDKDIEKIKAYWGARR